ncbi:efflux RND transporter periplasmic adaptor subunit [Maribacter hydrothermalis]|uniref:Membrane fusion protein, Cu(I)/Ag(I) efflux system n=1 Tax=Maribacter hydrothermalis TaxID=1836467 RepID=A0A1B7ZEE1_9FLAO|nr:efflux RND transporter periplasmic adaptor subunit [Maribacter hydrothermalis]APQ19249.1 hypothetical protein BTR34_04665 [Maribacter hydrothermalis]OBR41584.1 hypothetical protein A9200_12370 [Maribacter hydrothermalis]
MERYKKYGIYLVVLLVGLFLGYFLSGTSKEGNNSKDHIQHSQESSYTCSMHPSVVQAGNGTCPICGMDLVEITTENTVELENQFEMSERALALANIQTSIISSDTKSNSIKISGEITSNDKTNATQTTLFDGRLDKLEVNFIGEYVNKGQRIGTIYSPELYLAQDKLLTSSSYKETHEKLYAAARNTLGLWKLTDKQIDDLLKTGKPIVNFPLVADVSGTVTEIFATEGNYFKQGDPLFKVAKLNSVWAVFQAYENQIPFLKNGQEIVISSKAFNTQPVTAKISFIEPILNRGKRIVSVRADIDNKNGLWKPGMFVNAVVNIENKETNLIVVPKSAVLWTGERSVVYIKPYASKPVFEIANVQLGELVGENYIVLDGLNIGDEVVTNGAFTIDAAAQISGKKSMMYAREQDNVMLNTHKNNSHVVSPELNVKLKNSLNKYLALKDELVSSNSDNATKLAKELGSEIELIDRKNLDKEFQSNILAALEAVDNIQKSNKLTVNRLDFKNLSKSFVFLISKIDDLDNVVYVQHCPMADNNSGANWLSLEKAIKNPYFGDKMLTCGSVVKEVK